MSDAVLVEFADAITAEIKAARDAGRFVGLTFDLERSWADWDGDLEIGAPLRVDVVGINVEEAGLWSRDTIGYICSAEIYIRKKLGPDDLDQGGKINREKFDRLVKLPQEVHELFVGKAGLASVPADKWDSGKILASWSRRHLREWRMYYGATRVQFRTPRPRPQA